jgi:hypothetical protein
MARSCGECHSTKTPSHRFAVVVPDEALAAALRVPERLRRLLRIEVYAVTESGGVRRHD